MIEIIATDLGHEQRRRLDELKIPKDEVRLARAALGACIGASPSKRKYLDGLALADPETFTFSRARILGLGYLRIDPQTAGRTLSILEARIVRAEEARNDTVYMGGYSGAMVDHLVRGFGLLAIGVVGSGAHEAPSLDDNAVAQAMRSFADEVKLTVVPAA